MEFLRLGSDLTGPVGHQIHQQITALNFCQQISNGWIKHFDSSIKI